MAVKKILALTKAQFYVDKKVNSLEFGLEKGTQKHQNLSHGSRNLTSIHTVLNLFEDALREICFEWHVKDEDTMRQLSRRVDRGPISVLIKSSILRLICIIYKVKSFIWAL